MLYRAFWGFICGSLLNLGVYFNLAVDNFSVFDSYFEDVKIKSVKV